MKNLILKKGTKISDKITLLCDFDFDDFISHDMTVTVLDERGTKYSSKTRIDAFSPKYIKKLYLQYEKARQISH